MSAQELHNDSFATRLLAWFDQYGRKDLPWQKNINPYRVWVSEIMLQQTQVSTVIPYYERFMQRFPSVQSLAAADDDEVMHLWTGLGYYARARNLLRAARVVCDQHGGEFPLSVEGLSELPGIGRSTAGAIASIAQRQRAAILDGNVKRVLARYHAIEGWPGASTTLNTLWAAAERHTPHERVADYTQAIMDLGATLCTRSRPGCERCPMASDCLALSQGRVSDFPGKRPKKTLPERQAQFVLMRCPAGAVLMQRRPENGVWGGLWSFPELTPGDDPAQWVSGEWQVDVLSQLRMPVLRHTFSHYHLLIEPIQVEVARRPTAVAEGDAIRWVDPNDPGELGLPAPVARLLAGLGHFALEAQGEKP